jgi:hypothetical protein
VGRVVVDGLGPQRADDANLIGNRAEVREDLADLLARFAVLQELVLRPEALQLLSLKLRDWLPLGERFGHRLPVHLGQLGLVVERLQVRRPARHRQEDDPPGLGGQVQRMDCAAAAPGELTA